MQFRRAQCRSTRCLVHLLQEFIRPYPTSLIIHRKRPPILNGHLDWTAIGEACGIEDEMAELKKQLRPALDAIIRWLKAPPVAEDDPPAKLSTRASKVAPARKTAAAASTRKAQRAAADGVFARHTATSRGPAPKPISPFPDPLFDATDDPANFPGALIYLMGRFGDSYWQLCRAVGCELRHPAADRAALSITSRRPGDLAEALKLI